jgi:tRNA threonylcarbamoyladenosine biosynthesis protein TsaB
VKILAIDTATENCSAALLIDGNVRAREVEVDRGHAERILPMVDDLLAEANLSLGDLHAIAFGRGPGSFTGARLAATVTQGLAFGAGLGVVAVSDLQAVAQRVFQATPSGTAPGRVLVCNDARMSEVYWACFERGEDGIARLEGEEHVSKPSDVRLPQSWTVAATVTAAGRGFIAYAAALQAAVPTVLAQRPSPGSEAEPPTGTHASPIQLLPRATEIALLAVPIVTSGRLLPPEAATPVYLRDNVAHVAQAPKPSS